MARGSRRSRPSPSPSPPRSRRAQKIAGLTLDRRRGAGDRGQRRGLRRRRRRTARRGGQARGAAAGRGACMFTPAVPILLMQCVPANKRGAVMGLDSAVNAVARIVAPVAFGKWLFPGDGGPSRSAARCPRRRRRGGERRGGVFPRRGFFPSARRGASSWSSGGSWSWACTGGAGIGARGRGGRRRRKDLPRPRQNVFPHFMSRLVSKPGARHQSRLPGRTRVIHVGRPEISKSRKTVLAPFLERLNLADDALGGRRARASARTSSRTRRGSSRLDPDPAGPFATPLASPSRRLRVLAPASIRASSGRPRRSPPPLPSHSRACATEPTLLG